MKKRRALHLCLSVVLISSVVGASSQFASAAPNPQALQMPSPTAATDTWVDVCESRRRPTITEREQLLIFNGELGVLDSLRAPSQRTSYQSTLQSILKKELPNFTTEELKDKAAEFLLLEQFKQSMFETAGIDNREFAAFFRLQKEIEFFMGGSPQELRDALVGLQNKIHDWSEQKQAEIDKTGDAEGSARERLKIISQAEDVSASLDIVAQTLSHTMSQNSNQINDQLASYGQYLSTALGGGVVVGTMALSTPVVSLAALSTGAVGILVAGCSLGAVGGGAAALLQSQYRSYSLAWIESARHKTSYACELRRAVEDSHQNLISTFTTGATHGAYAGCAFTGAGIAIPKIAVSAVGLAVVLATGVEATMAVRDGYQARRSYLIYRSLLSLQKAEASSALPAQAQMYLRQAQMEAQSAGAHALNSILVGIVLVGGPKEFNHAFAAGREAILGLIGKSSDNAAVAVNLAGGFVNSGIASDPDQNGPTGRRITVKRH